MYNPKSQSREYYHHGYGRFSVHRDQFLTDSGTKNQGVYQVGGTRYNMDIRIFIIPETQNICRCTRIVEVLRFTRHGFTETNMVVNYKVSPISTVNNDTYAHSNEVFHYCKLVATNRVFCDFLRD